MSIVVRWPILSERVAGETPASSVTEQMVAGGGRLGNVEGAWTDCDMGRVGCRLESHLTVPPSGRCFMLSGDPDSLGPTGDTA